MYGQPYYIENRLNYTVPVHAATTPQQRPWTSSKDAPIQKFHWVHFPSEIDPGTYRYEVTARYCQNSSLVDGPKAAVSVQLAPQKDSKFELGLTRGYISSQAYASKFANKDIRPQPKSLDFLQQALNNAKSSIMFAIMELGGSGTVLQTIESLHLSGKLFSYGMTKSEKGFQVYKPGEPGVLVPFAFLKQHVPPPFDQEF